jgi:hypothetical protein
MVTVSTRGVRDRYWRAHLGDRGQGDRSIMARRPHDDGRPSLHITERKGRDALVRCFAGCAYAEVVAAIDGGRHNGHVAIATSSEVSPLTALPSTDATGAARLHAGLTAASIARAADAADRGARRARSPSRSAARPSSARAIR